VQQLREAVRSATESRVVVLPHLDLLTTSQGGLTSEAKEVIPLLYENPNLLWIGFKDPSMTLPQVILDLFPQHESILGVSRERLQHLVTQREARKFGRAFNPYQLYKYVSGVHAVKLRRLLGAIRGEDFPADPRPVLDQLRSATLHGNLAVPDVNLYRDIGGYTQVKERIQKEILDLLSHKEKLNDADAISRIEGLVPRGMIFWGPPGTGKTLFAKAIATALGAAITIVSGPELKSKWVGESEERIRQIFMAARQAAPSVIVFDEMDSFASARGTYTGSGVEHSMVNQLLTEMDGFRKNEMVFVIGTTNFMESLDGALLRPGRFEFHLEIPYPEAEDRRAILQVHNKAMGLMLSEEALDYAVRRTRGMTEAGSSRYSGDHLQALCRAIARRRVRENLTGPSENNDVEHALTAHIELPKLTSHEEKVVATHESGHAICAMHCPLAPPIERISIRGDLSGSLGFVQYSARAHRYVVTRGALLDQICSLLGGRMAEELTSQDPSIGCAQDLDHATHIARYLVEGVGMGEDTGFRVWEEKEKPSEASQAEIERAVRKILEDQTERARKILQDNKVQLFALRDLLLEKKVIDRAAIPAASS
jgi:cell division protease FtsH